MRIFQLVMCKTFDGLICRQGCPHEISLYFDGCDGKLAGLDNGRVVQLERPLPPLSKEFPSCMTILFTLDRLNDSFANEQMNIMDARTLAFTMPWKTTHVGGFHLRDVCLDSAHIEYSLGDKRELCKRSQGNIGKCQLKTTIA